MRQTLVLAATLVGAFAATKSLADVHTKGLPKRLPCAGRAVPELNHRTVGLIERNHPFEARNVMNPSALTLASDEIPRALRQELALPKDIDEPVVFLFYRAESERLKSSVGIAWSLDGVNFTQHHRPLYEGLDRASLARQIERYPGREQKLRELYKAEHTGGAEDPRLVRIKEHGKPLTYYMTYTAHAIRAPKGKDLENTSAREAIHMARLALARSTDLVHWERLGVLFDDPPIGLERRDDGWVKPYPKGWSKAGVILPKKLDGKYWMAFGDTSVFWATSKNLEDWTAHPVAFLNPRPGYGDERQVEPSWGLRLLDDRTLEFYYNGSNFPDDGAIYGLYVAHIDTRDMQTVHYRSDEPLIEPELPEEREGEVDNVVFTEGRVCLKGQQLFYYGAGDHEIGVASDQPLPSLRPSN